jgi:hypothetical protein
MLEELLENVENDADTDFSQSGRVPGGLESSAERIRWALKIVQDQNNSFQSLKEDLRLATEAVGKIMKTGCNIVNGPLALPTSLH